MCVPSGDLRAFGGIGGGLWSAKGRVPRLRVRLRLTSRGSWCWIDVIIATGGGGDASPA